MDLNKKQIKGVQQHQTSFDKEESWAAIQSKLDGKKKKRYAFLFFSGLLIFTVLALFLFQFKMQELASQEIQMNTRSAENFKSSFNNKNNSNDNLNNNGNDNDNDNLNNNGNGNLNEEEIVNGKSNDNLNNNGNGNLNEEELVNGKSNGNKNLNSNDNSNNNDNNNGKGNLNEQELVNGKSNGNKNLNSNDNSNNNDNLNNNNNGNFNGEEKVNGNDKSNFNLDSNGNLNEENVVNDKKNGNEKIIDDTSINKESYNQKVRFSEPLTYINKQSALFKWLRKDSPNFLATEKHEDIRSIELQLHASYGKPIRKLTKKDFDLSGEKERKESIEQIMDYMSLGIALKKQLSKRWFIKGGIEFGQITEHLSFTQQEINNIQDIDQKLIPDALTGKPGIAITTRKIDVFNRIRLLDIQASIGYQMSSKRWTISPDIGIGMNGGLRFKGYYSKNIQSLEGNANLYKSSIGLHGVTSISIGYRLSESLSVFAQPSFKHYFNEFELSEFPVQVNYEILYLKIGVGYKI